MLAMVLAGGIAGCGGSANSISGSSGTLAATPPTSTLPAPEDFPADVNAVHYHPINHAAFGPWYGSGCPDFGACGCDDATDLGEEFTCQMDHLAANDIPISVYLFDGTAWSARPAGVRRNCSGPDCCVWNLGDQVIDRLATGGVRGLLHFWGGCFDSEQYSRAHARLGHNLLGFYLDDGSSDGLIGDVSQYMQSAEPGDWENVAKAYQNREPSTTTAGLVQWANVAYMGDLWFDFGGLQEAVTRLLAQAPYIPAPFAEFTGYALDPGRPDENVYYRRLHFGALQPVMAHTPYSNADPWQPEYGPGLVQAYRYWTWLHKELVPYFYSYAYRMFENQTLPVIQAGPMAYSFLVGDEIYVPIVTEDTEAMTISLPPGQWIDYWDESHVVAGTLPDFAVPLGREPIFIRQGAMIPLNVERTYAGHGTAESRGSLTVLVFPNGTSSFRYRESARKPWITFTSSLAGAQLTLTADPGLPSQPVLYRIEGWPAPSSVGINRARVSVNQGGGVPAARGEAEVNGATQSSWFYDAPAQRLIIKVVP